MAELRNCGNVPWADDNVSMNDDYDDRELVSLFFDADRSIKLR